MFRYSLVLLAGLSAAGPTPAASWAEGMFEGLNRDFGAVPRGPVLSHPFRLTNNTGVPVTIGKVRTSCGCVTARPLHAELAPGQSSAVLVEMDTRRFQRRKAVTIYVPFTKPTFAEVRLVVLASSRDDVVVTPDTITFGPVRKGTAPTTVVTVSLLGNRQWRILGVASESNYVETALSPAAVGPGQVDYQITAHLRGDTPVGKWFTDIWLTTNNTAAPRIRLPLTVDIQSALSLSPSAVILGQVKAGVVTERKVVVRGAQPFRIVRVQGADGQWSIRDSTMDSTSIHVLTVSLKARQAGESNRVIRITTDLKADGEIQFLARAQVIP